MYLDYVSDLALTDNAYEITFQHTAKKEQFSIENCSF